MTADGRFPTAARSGVMAGFPPPPDRRVTLENWQRPPWNRWSFLHTREVLPTARIGRGPRTWRLPGQAVPGLEDAELEAGGARSTIGAFLDGSCTDGLIALRQGRVALEAYRSEMGEQSRHLVMSVSKSITALTVGILVDRGMMLLDAPVTRYVPELAATAYAGATIQHLLDMEVSMTWREDYLGAGSEFWRLDAACGWCPVQPGAAGTLLDFMREMRPEGAHGERTRYSSPNTDLLAMVAERVTGTRFSDLVTAELWAAIGAEHEGDLAVDPAGSAVADGGFCISLRDMARVGQLLLEGGRSVVPRWWVDQCLRGDPGPFAAGSYGADLPGGSYHNQWWHFDGRTFALGIHGQMIAVDPAAQVVVAMASSWPAPTDTSARDTQRAVVAALAAALR